MEETDNAQSLHLDGIRTLGNLVILKKSRSQVVSCVANNSASAYVIVPKDNDSTGISARNPNNRRQRQLFRSQSSKEDTEGGR